MVRLAMKMAAQRITALLAVACAVLGGAALVTATGVISESGLRSHLPPGRLAGADVVVTAPQTARVGGDLPLALPERAPVPAGVAERLGRVPGVETVVADVSFPAALVVQGHVLPGEAGHGWSSTTLLADPRIEGSAPNRPDEVAVDSAAGISVGDPVEIVAAGRPARYRVSAVVSGAAGGIYFADTTAAGLAGRGTAAPDRTGSAAQPGLSAGPDLVGLRAAPGQADRVASAVRAELRGTGLTVATGSTRGDAAAPEAGAARQLLLLIAGSLAGIILIIIGFVVAGALGVALSGQRRDLALMRAVGATPRQIRRLAAGQALTVTAVALVPGVALGYPLAGQFGRLLARLGLLPDGLPLSLSPLPAIAAVLLLGLVVGVSAVSSAWRLSRMAPTEAVAESRTEPRALSPVRTTAGMLLMFGGTALSVVPLLVRTPVGAATTSMAGILGAVGLALAGPALVRRAGDALGKRLPRRASAPTWLAVANVRGYVLRVGGVVASLAMVLVFVLTYALTQTTVQAAADRETRAGTVAQHTIAAPALGGVPVGLEDEVRSTAGVEAVSSLTTTTVLWPYRMFGEEDVESHTAMVLTPAAADVLDLGVTGGSLQGLTGATIAVGSDVAGSRDAEVGRTVALVLGDGARVEAKVVAVYDRELGFGPLVVSRDLVAGHTSTGLDASLLVRADSTDALTALVAGRPGLTLGSARPEASDTPPEAWINLALVVVLLAYLLLSIANKLVAATAQRRTEIAVLRLSGTTPRQVRAMIRREAALIAAGALVLGLALAAVPLALLGIGFLDRPWPAGPVWLLPAAVLTVVVTAFLTMELPARRALRVPPAEALRV
ncbi:FtsX-like permease family protein [Actinoplanes friuliensis]|uniref:ABC3 transporter permease C-terminal domain-containing protein n=1 Tax=Actinoplanes friuliensis DSM 7358 TaxID=1246995 RepID=U5VZ46_9ACTN|nr:FtsX family ABC transporter permease [Actinoplanes friuliensis]AGZ42253.1 hypothetical protein AFR_19905 [Actinoplanes friuliensis DSM 7358]